MVQPEGYEVDQRPYQFLMQAAESARERQRQERLLRQKDEEAKMSAFGGFQKTLIEQSQNLPYQLRSQRLSQAFEKNRQLVRSGADLATINASIWNDVSSIASEDGAYKQFNAVKKDVSKGLENLGFDKDLVEAGVSSSIYKYQVDPRTGQVITDVKRAGELEDPNEIVAKETKTNPHLYFNRVKGNEAILGVTKDIKPEIEDRATVLDPTGKRVFTVDYQTEVYPWTKAVPVTDAKTGAKYFKTVLDEEIQSIPDPTNPNKVYQAPLLSKKAFQSFMAANPVAANAITVGGIDMIMDKNKEIVAAKGYKDASGQPLDVSMIKTPEQFDELLNVGVELINPYDEGNREIYGNMYLINHPSMKQFASKTKVTIKDDKSSGTSINVYAGGSGEKPYTDPWPSVVKAVDSGAADPISLLDPETTEAILNIMDNSTMLRTAGVKTNPSMITLRRNKNGDVAAYLKDGQGRATGTGVLLSSRSLGKSINEGKPKQIAASNEPLSPETSSKLTWDPAAKKWVQK